MGLGDRIKVILDLEDSSFNKTLKNVRTNIIEADGTFGKFKAGAQGAFTMAGQYAGEFAFAAGAALVGWGVKAAGEFQKVALEAGRFAAATGIAVEDASRWLEVAGDFGVEGSAIEAALLKFNKALGAGSLDLDAFGGAIIRAKDGTIDANATFVDAVSKIGAIKDPTEQALAAQEAFGRGYKQIAELMELDAGALKAALDGVSDAKVIDEKELAKAREFRAAMDSLRDKIEDVTMWLGGKLVPKLVDAADKIEDVVAVVDKVNGAVDKLTGSSLVSWVGKAVDAVVPLDNVMGGLEKTFDKNSSAGERAMGVVETLTGGMPVLGEVVQFVGDKMEDTAIATDGLVAEVVRLKTEQDAASASVVLGAGHLAELEAAGREAKAATQDLNDEVARLSGKLSAKEAWLSLQDSIDGFVAKMQSGEASSREIEQGLIDVQQELLDFTAKLDGVPESKKTEIIAMIDEGNIAGAEAALAALTVPRSVRITANVSGRFDGGVYDSGARARVPAFDGGGVVPGLKGEPRLVLAHGGERISPDHRLPTSRRAGGGVTITGPVTLSNGVDIDAFAATLNFKLAQ